MKYGTDMETVRKNIDKHGEYKPDPLYRGYRTDSLCEHCGQWRSLNNDALCRECRRILGARE